MIPFRYLPKMPPRSKTTPTRRLFFPEWMKALGYTDESLADKMGVARNTVYRWRKEPQRIDSAKQALIADALGLDSPADLWYQPGRRRIDSMLADADDKQFADTVAFIERFVLGR